MPALGMTDRDMLTGAVEFYQACLDGGLQPILGLELLVGAPARLQSTTNHNLETTSKPLALLAMDLSGWRSLCRLSSALLSFPERPAHNHLPFESLAQDSSGLICLTGGTGSQLDDWVSQRQERLALEYLQRLHEVFPDRLYIEVHRTPQTGSQVSNQLVSLARQIHLPVVATHPIYYLTPEQAPLHRLATAIRLNCHLEDVPKEAMAPEEACFIPPHEIEVSFADLPAALHATQEIAARCRLELPLGQPHFPRLELPGGQDPDQALRQKAYAGAQRLYGEINPTIRDRLDHELIVIEQKGYTSLFLIMEEIIQFAHQADIPTASRGSASSSLVAHCLGITTPDPIRLDLYFERFLNPARTTPPDIDTDLCSRRRDDVIRHVYQTYGSDRVAMIGTINRFRARSALREVAKAYGLPPAEIKVLSEAIPYRGWVPNRGKPGVEWSPYAELAERYPSPRHQAIFRDALALSKTPHHLSVHAGGVVISPGPLTDLLPTMLANKGMLITQLDLDSVEKLGLVKLDLLGIRGLSVLGEVAEGLSKQHSPPHPSRLSILDSIPLDDQLTAQTIRTGRTIGCFQIESPGMRATLREIQARSVDDLLVALALYRPGPLTGGLKDTFVRRHLGQEPVSHLHPALESLLADTYGVILYQEQVLRIAHELAGLDLAEADLLRRAMSHFDPGKQMQTLKEKFIAGALKHRAVPPETGERIWELMAAFAGYGFPKAHAASYAQVAWRSAWCKTHHPAEFMAAVLANWGGYYSQRVYLMEVRRLGLALRPPHINFSQPEFSVSYPERRPTLYMGLDQVRELTRRTQHNILRQRPFLSLQDFLARADPRPAEAENLVRAGALDGMGNIPTLLLALKSGRQARQMSLFPHSPDEPATLDANDWTPAEQAAQQEAILGVSIDLHPLELVAKQFEQQDVITTAEAAAHPGRHVRVAGMRQTWQRLPGPHGGYLYSMTLEDLEGMLEVIVPASLYNKQRASFSGRIPLIVEGVIEIDPDSAEPFLRAEKIWRVS
jgi:DNA-directed DNA polymerase III PolC